MNRAWPRTDKSPASLAAALAGFAAATSELQVLSLVHDVVTAHFGALHATLLTRQPAALSVHRHARLTGGAAAPGIGAGRPELGALLRKGSVFATETPRVELPDVPVPEGAGFALVLPCAESSAMNAVCAFWSGPKRRFAPAELHRLRLVAAMAGLAFDRQLAEARTRLLRADLENRIRNVLAVVRGVGTRSAERALSLEDFLLHFEGRIDAIGRSQLAATRTGEISFEHLLREELLAQAIQDGDDVSLDGMDVSVSPEQAEALGLALHELAVNAVKFGAFAGPDGCLAVRWWGERRGERTELTIDWRERCAAAVEVAPPAGTGFGLTYLDRALPFQLGAEVTLDFAPRGLHCRIAVPLGAGAGLNGWTIPGGHGDSHPLDLDLMPGGHRRAAAGSRTDHLRTVD